MASVGALIFYLRNQGNIIPVDCLKTGIDDNVMKAKKNWMGILPKFSVDHKINKWLGSQYSFLYLSIRKYPWQQSTRGKLGGTLCLYTHPSMGRNAADHNSSVTSWTHKIRW